MNSSGAILSPAPSTSNVKNSCWACRSVSCKPRLRSIRANNRRDTCPTHSFLLAPLLHQVSRSHTASLSLCMISLSLPCVSPPLSLCYCVYAVPILHRRVPDLAEHPRALLNCPLSDPLHATRSSVRAKAAIWPCMFISVPLAFIICGASLCLSLRRIIYSLTVSSHCGMQPGAKCSQASEP
jgi:hypothetical protein